MTSANALVVKRTRRLRRAMRAVIAKILLLLFAFARPAWAYTEPPCFTARQAEAKFGNAIASKIIKLAIDNWMQTAREDWKTWQEPATSDSKLQIPPAEPKWVFVDSSCVPARFHLRTTAGIPVKLVHPLPEMMQRGYFYMATVQFQVQQDGAVRVVFAYKDWRIGGATAVTYLASKHNGAWSVRLIEAFSP